MKEWIKNYAILFCSWQCLPDDFGLGNSKRSQSRFGGALSSNSLCRWSTGNIGCFFWIHCLHLSHTKITLNTPTWVLRSFESSFSNRKYIKNHTNFKKKPFTNRLNCWRGQAASITIIIIAMMILPHILSWQSCKISSICSKQKSNSMSDRKNRQRTI